MVNFDDLFLRLDIRGTVRRSLRLPSESEPEDGPMIPLVVDARCGERHAVIPFSCQDHMEADMDARNAIRLLAQLAVLYEEQPDAEEFVGAGGWTDPAVVQRARRLWEDCRLASKGLECLLGDAYPEVLEAVIAEML